MWNLLGTDLPPDDDAEKADGLELPAEDDAEERHTVYWKKTQSSTWLLQKRSQVRIISQPFTAWSLWVTQWLSHRNL